MTGHEMNFEFDNSCLKSFTGIRNRIPGRFYAEGISCKFSLNVGKDGFSWSGIRGERYAVVAPLNATAWGEKYRTSFGHWRCAVFVPPDVEKSVSLRRMPIVFLFDGIGGDYSNTGIYLRKLIQNGKCIAVAFDTHLTGERNLVAPGTCHNDAFVGSLKIMEHEGCVMRNETFREMVEEMAFNVLQVRMFLHLRYGVGNDVPLYMLGFSLGGFYATQIALCLNDCRMCVAGAAAPDITLYSGALFGTMRNLPEWLFSVLFHQDDLKAEARAVRSVTRTPFNIANPVCPDLKINYVIGECDPIVSAEKVKKYCSRRVHDDRVHVVSIPHVGHTSGSSDGLNDLGNLMVDTLAKGIQL